MCARSYRGGEDLAAPECAFELVAIGNAFHRLQRTAVAKHTLRWLQPGRCIALLWANSPWAGDADWQRALSAVLARWKIKVGAQTRLPAGWDQARRERSDLAVLTACGLQPVRSSRFPTFQEWTVDMLIGLVYSTSFLSRAVLGDRVEAFENDLRRELNSAVADGKLWETIDFAYELARRPS